MYFANADGQVILLVYMIRSASPFFLSSTILNFAIPGFYKIIPVNHKSRNLIQLVNMQVHLPPTPAGTSPTSSSSGEEIIFDSSSVLRKYLPPRSISFLTQIVVVPPYGPDITHPSNPPSKMPTFPLKSIPPAATVAQLAYHPP